MKGCTDLAMMTGWSTEMFARTKRMKPLEHYLKPGKPKTAETGARDVRRMFDKMIAKQGEDDGTR